MTRQIMVCPTCGEWYLLPDPLVSCNVAHSPGTCCHYMQTKIVGPEVDLAEADRERWR